MRLIGEPDEIVAARLMEAALVWGTFGLDEAEQLTAEIRAEAAEHDRPERLDAEYTAGVLIARSRYREPS